VNYEGTIGGINRLNGVDDTMPPITTNNIVVGENVAGGIDSALSAENRYGLVGEGDTHGTSPRYRYGLVGSDLAPPVDGGSAIAPATMVAKRIMKTPRRRLLSEGIFGWMMENRNSPIESTRRRSRSHSQRSGVKGKLRNQKLMSEFVSNRKSPQ